jgi:hypothetical protein
VDVEVLAGNVAVTAVVEVAAIHRRTLVFPTWPVSTGPVWEPLPSRGWQTGERNPDGA